MSRTSGFRYHRWDSVVLTVSGILTLFASVWAGELALLLPLIVIHFFLFCNVFRVRFVFELLWSVVLFLQVSYFMSLPDPIVTFDWRHFLAVQLSLTVVLILWEVQSPRYHGIYAKEINPSLERK